MLLPLSCVFLPSRASFETGPAFGVVVLLVEMLTTQTHLARFSLRGAFSALLPRGC